MKIPTYEELEKRIQELENTVQALKKRETTFRENEDTYFTFINSSPDPVVILQDGCYKLVSAAFTELFGYTQQDVDKGLSFFELVQEKDRDSVRARYEDRLAGKKVPKTFRIDLVAKDGAIIPCETSGALIQYYNKPADLVIIHDISERIHIEEKLCKERDRAQSYLDIANVILIVINAEGEVTLINKKGCEVLGYDENEIIGKNWFDTFLPEMFRTQVKAVSKRILSGEIKPVDHYENPVLTKNGEERIILWNNRELRDDTGNIIGHISSGEDITERKRTEESQKQSEEKYRNLLDNMRSGCTVYESKDGQDFILVDMNDTGLKMDNLKKEDLIGKSVYELFPKAIDRHGIIDTFKRVWHTGKSERLTPCNYEINNNEVWRDNFFYKLSTGEIIVIYDDITERIKSETALRKRNIQLELIQSVQQEIPINIDLDSILQKASESIGRLFGCFKVSINLYNKSTDDVEYLYGWQKTGKKTPRGYRTRLGDGIIGTAAKEKRIIVANDVSKEPLYKVYNIRETKAELTIPLIVEDELLAVLDIQDTKLNAFSEDDVATLQSIANYLAYTIDLKLKEKERKNLEEQLFQSQKMESIGRLAGGIAHDFNNILTSIMGYAEMLKMKFSDINTPEGLAADVILQGAERAADLTKQLLGFARKGKFNPVTLNINTVVEDTIKVSEKIFEKRIRISLDLDRNLAPVEADKNQLDQVLTNLFINARDAMPDGGELILKTENVYLDEKYTGKFAELEPGHFVKISITDSGVGIPKGIRGKIFEPFFTTKGEGKGTGLGLATVYGIVKNHDGQINVYSEPGEGATFTLYFPVSSKKITRAQKEIEIIRGEATVLVVDDEESVRKLTERMLKSMGYRVILAKDGREAVEIYRKKRDEIDLVLLDMIMPGMTGRETNAALQKIDPAVKVILASGYSRNGKAAEILSEGVLGFIQKPFRIQELSKIISDIVKKRPEKPHKSKKKQEKK